MIPPERVWPRHQHNGHRADPHDRFVHSATHTRRNHMRSTTDYINEGHEQTAPRPTDACEPEGIIDDPRETEASFEEIER
jgi:hypothetical protein